VNRSKRLTDVRSGSIASLWPSSDYYPEVRTRKTRSNAPRVDRTSHPGALDVAPRHAEFQKGLCDDA